MKLFYTSKKTGFTLIELIVSIAISSIILLVLFNAFNNSINTYKVLSKYSKGYNDCEFAINYIADEVGAASFVVSAVDDDEILIGIDRGKNVKSSSRYQHISYRKKSYSIYRYSVTSAQKYNFGISKFKSIGTNRIADDIESFKINLENGVVTVEIVSTSGLIYKKNIAVRCRDET